MSGLRFVGYRNNKLNRKGLKDIYKEAFPKRRKDTILDAQDADARRQRRILRSI